jgi:selenocysteine lyase/cysteine desulfurase
MGDDRSHRFDFFHNARLPEDFPGALDRMAFCRCRQGLYPYGQKCALSRLRRYEFGTQNLQTILAFQKALDYLKAIGFENIRNRMLELTDHLIAGLKKLGVRIVSPIDKPEERSPIVSFSLGDKNKECLERLTQESISVSPRAGYIRVSVNIFNNTEDIDKLLSVLRSVISVK